VGFQKCSCYACFIYLAVVKAVPKPYRAVRRAWECCSTTVMLRAIWCCAQVLGVLLGQRLTAVRHCLQDADAALQVSLPA
jgi:hypothetical protein